jgi:hypothetical protein
VIDPFAEPFPCQHETIKRHTARTHVMDKGRPDGIGEPAEVDRTLQQPP